MHPLECSFELPAGVELYGNFCGDEPDDDLDIRDPLDDECVTILDGKFNESADGRVLHVVRAVNSGLNYIDGFTIRNGFARGWRFLDDEDDPPTPIVSTFYGSSGGGMLVDSSHAVIVMCTFENNDAGDSLCLCTKEGPFFCVRHLYPGSGGGLALHGGGFTTQSATILNSIFRENTAMIGTELGGSSGPMGGAIFKETGFGVVTIMNSLFYDNLVDAREPPSCFGYSTVYNWDAVGGALATGVSCGGSHAVSVAATYVWNSTMYSNELIGSSMGSADGAAIWAGRFVDNEFMHIRNSIVWNNVPQTDQVYDLICSGKIPIDVAHSNIQGGWSGSGSGNINEDPEFENASARNFRLTSSSPSINTGTRTGIPLDVFDIARTGWTDHAVPDLDLRSRVIGCQVDMGAFEFLTPTTAPGLEDLNSDCCVDIGDLFLLLSKWGPCPAGACPADLNGDGAVDFSDLLQMFSAWGAGCPSGPLPIETFDDCFERIGLSDIEALTACLEAMMSQE